MIKLKKYLIYSWIALAIPFVSCEQKGNKSRKLITKVIEEPSIYFGIVDSGYTIKSGVVAAGENITQLLQNQGLNPVTIDEIISKAKDVFDLTMIHQGQNYHSFFSKKDSLCYFVYEINKIDYLRVRMSDRVTEKLTHKVSVDTVLVEGTITSSLWKNMNEKGFDVNLALKMSDIFAWTIDFYGIEAGDSYSIYYERKRIDTTYIGFGEIIALRFTHAGKAYRGFQCESEGKIDYFDEMGKSLKRAFLKAPLQFSRISSKFSNSRMHPVLKIRRPHHGVDYAASTGTPVMSIGNGTVTFAAYKGGYGKRVEIKHSNNYSSGYAHLSRIAPEVKKGSSVRQGQIIGYVGSTGLSSGPHLDFRVYQGKTAIDPLKLISPPANPVEASKMDDFMERVSILQGVIK